MASMTRIVIHNSMITHANVTIPKSMAVRIESIASAVRIAHRDLSALRVRWVQGARQGHKVFPVSEAR